MKKSVGISVESYHDHRWWPSVLRNNEKKKEALLKSKEKQLVALTENIKQDDDDNDDDVFSARYEGRDNERLSRQENILRNLWQKNRVYRQNFLGKLILIT